MIARLLMALALLALAYPARAQQAIVIPTCGTANPSKGSSPLYIDANGNLCAGTSPAAAVPVTGGQMGLGIVTSTALTVPATATAALVTVEGQAVRWRDDGTAPTASVGNLLPVGTTIAFYRDSMKAVQFIQTAATATISVAYYK